MTGDHGGLVTPEGGVAIATPVYAVLPASPRANAQISLRPMSRPFLVMASTTRIGSSTATDEVVSCLRPLLSVTAGNESHSDSFGARNGAGCSLSVASNASIRYLPSS